MVTLRGFFSHRGQLVKVLFTLLIILLVTVIVYQSGGTFFVWPHLYYAVIILAAYWFGPLGGTIVGAICGMAAGPLMPLYANPWTLQQPSAWLFRLLFFSGLGLLFGLIVQTLKMETEKVRINEHELKALAAKLEATHEQTLRALVMSIEARDMYTRYHSDRVARYAMILGREMGLLPTEINLLGWSGLLHDLGKVGIPEKILTKKGCLTDNERRILQQHAELSYKILRPVDAMKPILDLVLYHHEKYDGSGYPHALHGEEIPLLSRILAVADVFEALTADRPYRLAWEKEEAVSYILLNSGTLFDPKVVEAFKTTYQGFPTHAEEKNVGGIAFRELFKNN